MKDVFAAGIFVGFAASFMAVAGTVAFATFGTILATVQAIAPIAVTCSAIVAFRLYQATVRRHAAEDIRKRSEVYLEECKKLLDRAYETFTRYGADPPKADRLLWLSTARMIQRFRLMRQRLIEEDHVAIADESEEYVRLKFKTTLDTSRDKLTTAYFMPSGNIYAGDEIARKSIAVIFEFANWRAGATDPLECINDKQLIANGAIPSDFTGVDGFIAQYQTYWEEIEAMKAETGGTAT